MRQCVLAGNGRAIELYFRYDNKYYVFLIHSYNRLVDVAGIRLKPGVLKALAKVSTHNVFNTLFGDMRSMFGAQRDSAIDGFNGSIKKVRDVSFGFVSLFACLFVLTMRSLIINALAMRALIIHDSAV